MKNSQNDWIKITEKLPENESNVEILGVANFVIPCQFIKTEKGFTFYEKSKINKGVSREYYGVTNWRPIVKEAAKAHGTR